MKKNIILLLLCFTYISFSQDFEIGIKVTKQDLAAKIYKKDSSANALIIYDYGNAFFNKETWSLNIEYERKIKILTKEGLNRANIEIPIYTGGNPKENITEISATTYNLENGKFTASKMDKSSIYKEENDKWTLVKFVLPNVKVGSVITYSYKKETKYITKYQPWYFQHNDPTLYSEYNTSIPGNYQYHTKLVGSIPLKIKDNSVVPNCIDAGGGAYAGCSVSRYVMENIPAYKKESYTTTPENYLSRIEYELSVIKSFNGEVDKKTKTWSNVESELKKDSDLGRQLKKASSVKDLLPATILKINNKLEKAKAIYQFVLNNYKWNGDFGRHDASINRLEDENGGNAFELNLFLHNLLKSEGYSVIPILISTRQNGLATKLYPVITDFNYLILKLTLDEEESYLLDATDPFLAFGEIPFYCLNQYGRLIDFKNGSSWIDIEAMGYTSYQIGGTLKLNQDELLEGQIKINTTGYNAHSKKKDYYENSSTYIESLKSNFAFSSLNSHKVTSNKTDSKFSEELDITIEGEFIAGKIYFNPFLFKYFEENPFKLQERTYPVDFGYKQSYYYGLEIDLGDNLKIIELPKNKTIALPNKSGSVNFMASVKGKKLNISSRITLKNPIYGVEYYAYLKTFMSKIVEIQNNTIIVLEKK